MRTTRAVAMAMACRAAAMAMARRAAAMAMAGLLGATAIAVIPGEPQRQDPNAPPDWVSALDRSQSGTASVPWQESTSAPLATSTGVPDTKFAFPAAGSWTVTLGKAGADDQRAVKVAPKVEWATGEPLRVEVLDRAAAARAGASGFVFTVSDVPRPAGQRELPAQLTIDYSGFANAYGAGYADRLQVVALAKCATADPVPANCQRTATRLPTRNDAPGKLLVADVADLSGTFAVTSAVGGDGGTFAATPLSISGAWQVAPGSGAFTYSYPIGLPVPAGGSAPSVSLNYSSAAIDGLTVASNTQGSPSGVGWSDFANAFIERRYEPCFRKVGTTDLCWKSDNATISLGGISGVLIPTNAAHTEWKVQSDAGWRIERHNDAPYTTIHENQRWKVTGPDGTTYWFGYGHMPGRVTNSILAVPVLADHSGEPCRTPDDKVGACDQGWRWYLDRVEDPDGNVQSYLYDREDNWYSAIGGLAGNAKYHRGAQLKEIIYGGRGWDSENYAARVTFGLQWRCGLLVPECPAPTAANGGSFLDVPNDLICTQSSACSVHAPSFFTGKRYSHVRTEVKVGTAWKLVAQHNIIHSFGTGAAGEARKLQMEELQHAAIAFGKLNAYPSTKFDYKVLDNRADHSSNIPKAMRHTRIDHITNPFGGTVAVTYFQNRGCAQTYDPWPRWDQNVRDCFPQSVKDGALLRTGIYNKYLVKEVTENPGNGSPAMTTAYAYAGDPAWAFDLGAFARDEDETGWSLWRGYGEVMITKGTAKTRLKIFRGWNDDPTLVQVGGDEWVPLGKRIANVVTFDGLVSYPDDHALAGRTLEEQQLGTINGVADRVIQSRRHEYEKRVTYDPGPDELFDVEWVGVKSTTESVASTPTLMRHRRSQTTYNQNFQPATTLEEGWLDQSGDERCSITTYADNPARGMFGYPASNKKVAGTCASAQVLTLSESYYDGSATLGSLTGGGNVTRQRTLIEGSRWSESATEFDALGRPVRVTGPTGAATTTAYAVTAGAPVTQIPIQTTVTNALGHQEITDWHPEFGIPSREQDANGNITFFGYDEFGRISTVWSPTEPVAFLEPSWRFSYDIPNRAVRSQRLTSDARSGSGVIWDDTWVIYDGFWRERQTQSRSPVSGKVLISETGYDDRGLLRDETVEQAFTSAPGKLIAATGWLNRTRHHYDELGRDVRKEWWRGNAPAHATTTAYETDTVTVTGPDGRKVRERIDGLGRTAAVEEHDGQGWVSSSYRYDLADRLVSVTDPAGNRIDYSYNLAGWRIGQVDPNRGNALFGYDNAGNQTVVVDGAANQIHTKYDPLGRKTERRAGSLTGQLLAAWTYDGAAGGKGHAQQETTYTSAGNWVSEVLGYDGRSRVTGSRLTVPAGIPGLSGSYEVRQTYDRADRVRTVTYPAIGGLAQESVTVEYNASGLPTRMAGLDEYVWGAAYDDRGRKVSAGFGPRPGGATWLAKTWTYNVDQRINGAETFITGSDVVSDHELAFDSAGNLTENLTWQNGLAWRECFGYDARSRLTSAHTVAATTACAGGQAGTGDRPYVHGYQYSPDGKLLARSVDGVNTAYTYPAAGAARPHAPTRVGTDNYTWDSEGRLAARGAQTFAWDVEDRLISATGTGGATTFVYDASGQRLLRRTPNGQATLYLAGHEVTANAAGTSVIAVRPYTFDGQLVATRTVAGVEYLVSDAAGSVEMAIPAGGQPTATRSYDPYGRVRAQTGDPATDRGFIGQVEDASTGLSYLNARYYDTKIGVFLSTDALYDTAKVKTLNPYSYSSNNPVTFADPSGLYSMYAYGLEIENSQLRAQNKELIAHIGRLGNHIEHLQDIIRKQQKQIKELIAYAAALEAEIARQATIIRQLQARVSYLEGVVVAQQREISRLRRIVAYQQRVIRYQASVIRYQRGVIFHLTHRDARPSRPTFAGSGVRFLGGGNRPQMRGYARIAGGDDDAIPDCLFGKNDNGSCTGSSAWPWSKHAGKGNYCIFGGGSNDDGGCRFAGIVAPFLGWVVGETLGKFCKGLCEFGVEQFVEDRLSDLRRDCGGWGDVITLRCFRD